MGDSGLAGGVGRIIAATILLLLPPGCVAQPARAPFPETASGSPTSSGSPYSEIAAIRTYVTQQADKLWPGLSEAPFGILLIEEDREILLCDDRLPGGFERASGLFVTGCSAAIGPSSWRNRPVQLAQTDISRRDARFWPAVGGGHRNAPGDQFVACAVAADIGARAFSSMAIGIARLLPPRRRTRFVGR